MVGRDQQRRQTLAPANLLPGYDLPVDGIGGKSFDVAGADEHAGNGTALEQSIDFGGIAITDDEMPTKPGQLRGISGKHAGANAMELRLQRQCCYQDRARGQQHRHARRAPDDAPSRRSQEPCRDRHQDQRHRDQHQ